MDYIRNLLFPNAVDKVSVPDALSLGSLLGEKSSTAVFLDASAISHIPIDTAELLIDDSKRALLARMEEIANHPPTAPSRPVEETGPLTGRVQTEKAFIDRFSVPLFADQIY